MDSFSAYQHNATATAIYPGAKDPNDISGLSYAVLGLNGEAGEVADKVKKVLRDRAGVMDDETKASILAELGDVLWYVSAVATQLGVPLGVVAADNLRKLRSREARGVLKGSGDAR